MNFQVEPGVVAVVPATYTLTPTMKFTEAQKNDDTKKYSSKDIFDACAKVAAVTQAATPEAAQPISRG